MKMCCSLWMGLLSALFAVDLAFAQVGGSIVGTVTDQTGQPLGGVKVSVKSDTQIGGTKTAYSSSDGVFRIVGLQPGVFEVSATAPGLRRVIQKDIQVGITAATDVDLMMEVETGAEEVRVIATAPTISTTAANVKEVFDVEFIENLPLDGLATKVEPFIQNNMPGAGGGGDRHRGGSARQNQFMVEGFTMINQRYTMKSLATIEAQGAAYGAENAAAQGIVVNMVTKSGSNKFEFDVSGFHEDNRLMPFREANERAATVTRTNINPAIAGPIIKDKLWYYLNIEARYEHRGYDSDPAGLRPQLPPEKTYIGRNSFKLTWQVSPRHKISSFSLYNLEGYRDRSDGNYDRDLTTLYTTPRMSFFSGITWEALLSDTLFLRSQVGVQGNESQWIPQSCLDSDKCWHVPPVEQRFPRTILQNNYEQVIFDRNRGVELINTLEWFPSNKRFGDHNLKLTSRYYARAETSYLGVPGDRKTILNGEVLDRQIEYYSNDPRVDGEARHGYFVRGAIGRILLHSISDSIRVTRYLNLNAGLALTTALSDTNAGKGALNMSALTPHLSGVWDMTHDGRTVMRAGIANYVDADAVRISRYALGDQTARECRWDEATQSFSRDCQYRGGAKSVTFGLPCGPQGINADGTPCARELQLPRMWEYTLGAEREVTQGVSLATDFIYRKFSRPFEMTETNRIWNRSGTGLEPSGGYRNGRAELIQDLETPDDAERRYLGVTAVARKRAGPLKIQMGYTWSRLEGNVDSVGDTNPYGDIGPRDLYLWGYLQDDRRHDIRGAATYQVNRWLSLGTTYSYSSGKPYSRTFPNEVTGRSEDYRATIGVDPGTNINDPGDDRALRLPDIQRVNLKILANLEPLFGSKVEVYVDFLNVLNLRTINGVVTQDGPSFGAPRSRMESTLMRLGGRYRF